MIKTKKELHSIFYKALSEGRIRPQVPDESLALCEFLVERKQPLSRVIEIGVGMFSTPIWMMMLEKDGLLVGIDPDPRVLGWISSPPYCVDTSRLAFIRSHSEYPDTLTEVGTLLDEGSVDLLHIDGDHSYLRPEFKPPCGVKPDFDNYRRFVRSGGLVVFHDTSPTFIFPGPRQFFAELREEYEGFTIGTGLGYGVIYL